MHPFNPLERRIIDLSYRHRLSHISSCLNTVNLLLWIYGQRKPGDPVILGNGHAGLALYVALEGMGLCDAEELLEEHGVHPHRDMANGIWCSSGSLGQAETVALGFALADRVRTVWLVTSDGSCAEGSVYETMRIATNEGLINLRTYVIFNGFSAYGPTCMSGLPDGFTLHYESDQRYPEWMRGINGHYVVLDQAQYEELISYDQPASRSNS